MRKEEAEREARRVAREEGVEMAITFDSFSEEPDERERFGFMPARAAETIFTHETIVERVPAGAED